MSYTINALDATSVRGDRVFAPANGVNVPDMFAARFGPYYVRVSYEWTTAECGRFWVVARGDHWRSVWEVDEEASCARAAEREIERVREDYDKLKAVRRKRTMMMTVIVGVFIVVASGVAIFA